MGATPIGALRYRNSRHKGVVNILYTYNKMASRLQKILSRHNLTLAQYNILRILSRQHPHPACNCTIRDQMLDARSDITRIVDRLIKEELVTREACHKDRRKVNIMLTEEGCRLLERLDSLNDEMDGILKDLSEEELGSLNRLLEKIRKHL